MPRFGERFLAHPDLVPARQYGEPWGAERIALRIAGNDFICAGLSLAQVNAIRARFGTLCDLAPIPQRTAVTLQVFRIAAEEFFDGDRTWSYEFDLDYAPAAVRVAGHHVVALLEWKSRLHAALWTCDDLKLVSHGILENVLRPLVAYHLLEDGGLLLHSGAVASNGFADVFFGHSGAGKSTLSRLGHESGRRVLSDDLNALRFVDGELMAVKLPFAGDFGSRIDSTFDEVAVRGLYRIEKGPEPARRPLKPALAVAALLGCAPYVNANPHRQNQLLARLEEICAHRPVEVLTFAPNAAIWQFLDR